MTDVCEELMMDDTSANDPVIEDLLIGPNRATNVVIGDDLGDKGSPSKI